MPGKTRRAVLVASILAGAGSAATAATPRALSRGGNTHGDPDPIRFSAMPPPAEARETLARIPGADLWYTDTGGTGEAIVLLHPNTGSGHVWGHQQPALARAGYRVIAYSRRGFRGSSTIDPAQPGRGDEDLAALADALGLRRFHAVGTAAGAFVAASLAMTQPDRLISLTLACTIVAITDRQIADRLTFLREAWWQALPHDFRELSPSYRVGNPEGLSAWRALNDTSRGENPAASQPPGMTATLSTLGDLKVPTLLIAGDADLYAPPPIARLMAKAIPGSELVVIPECGHSAHWERPEIFNRVLVDFVGRHRA